MKTILLLCFMLASCQGNPKQPIETGNVKWSRDLDSSLAASKKSGKPIFLLFQEVPG